MLLKSSHLGYKTELRDRCGRNNLNEIFSLTDDKESMKLQRGTGTSGSFSRLNLIVWGLINMMVLPIPGGHKSIINVSVLALNSDVLHDFMAIAGAFLLGLFRCNVMLGTTFWEQKYCAWLPGILLWRLLLSRRQNEVHCSMFAQRAEAAMEKKSFIAWGFVFFSGGRAGVSCAPNEQPALKTSFTSVWELCNHVIRNSALRCNYIIAVIKGSSSP